MEFVILVFKIRDDDSAFKIIPKNIGSRLFKWQIIATSELIQAEKFKRQNIKKRKQHPYKSIKLIKFLSMSLSYQSLTKVNPRLKRPLKIFSKL